MGHSNIVIGIDLGTTYSTVAYLNQHGKAEIISNREGERTTPSVILFDGDTPIVGTIAKRSATSSPLNVCQFVKRQMGEKDWRFLTENDKEYTPEEISALILRRLKEDAEIALDTQITDAVVTVPAYFNDAQRSATKDAGKIAGLNVLRVVNEPTAAALAYGLDNAGDQTIMVYDLGGGTFDVTIIKIKSGDISVIATGGDKNLGGFDWDNKIMNYLNEEYQKEGGVDLFDNLSAQQDLRDKAEIAKKTLSSRDKTKIFISVNGKSASVSLTREDFEKITEDLLKRTQTLMEMTIEDAKIAWSDIDKILLVGGSTRMKAVPELIKNVSGQKPSAELHADEVVAMGAALLGGILQKQKGDDDIRLDSLPDVRISDVNSHSLGVIVLDGLSDTLYNSIILPKDTKIPTRASELYGTSYDNQESIEVKVTEGEERDLEYVRVIGKGSMDIPPYPKGAPVEVFFQYDEDGIVHITVFDKTSDKILGELQIKRESNRTSDELSRMKSDMEKIEIQ